jgi:hypothetical protein
VRTDEMVGAVDGGDSIGRDTAPSLPEVVPDGESGKRGMARGIVHQLETEGGDHAGWPRFFDTPTEATHLLGDELQCCRWQVEPGRAPELDVQKRQAAPFPLRWRWRG